MFPIQLHVIDDNIVLKLIGQIPSAWAKECLYITSIQVADYITRGNVLHNDENKHYCGRPHIPDHLIRPLIASWWKQGDLDSDNSNPTNIVSRMTVRPDVDTESVSSLLDWHVRKSQGNYSVLATMPGNLSIRFDFSTCTDTFSIEISSPDQNSQSNKFFAAQVQRKKVIPLEIIENVIDVFVVPILGHLFAIPSTVKSVDTQTHPDIPNLVIDRVICTIPMSLAFEAPSLSKDEIKAASIYVDRGINGRRTNTFIVSTMPPLPDVVMAAMSHLSSSESTTNVSDTSDPVHTLISRRPWIYTRGIYTRTSFPDRKTKSNSDKVLEIICEPVGISWWEVRARVQYAVVRSVEAMNHKHANPVSQHHSTNVNNDEFADILESSSSILPISPHQSEESQNQPSVKILEKTNLAALQRADPELFQYISTSRRMYSTVCQQHRQPVQMTQEEASEWSTHTDEIPISVGSTPQLAVENVYACPDVWCPLSRKAMTMKEFEDAGRTCPEDVQIEGQTEIKVIDKRALPLIRQHRQYIGLLDPKMHPNGTCVPCCFKNPLRIHPVCRKQISKNADLDENKNENDATKDDENIHDFNKWITDVSNQTYIASNSLSTRILLLPQALHILFNQSTQCGSRFDGSGVITAKCAVRQVIDNRQLQELLSIAKQDMSVACRISSSRSKVSILDIVNAVRTLRINKEQNSTTIDEIQNINDTDIIAFWDSCPEYVSKVLPYNTKNKKINLTGPSLWRERRIVYALQKSSIQFGSKDDRNDPFVINFNVSANGAHVDTLEEDVCRLLKIVYLSSSSDRNHFIATTTSRSYARTVVIEKQHLVVLKDRVEGVSWKIPIFTNSDNTNGNSTNESFVTPLVQFLRDNAAIHVDAVLQAILQIEVPNNEKDCKTKLSKKIEAIIIDFNANAYGIILTSSHAVVWFPQSIALDAEILDICIRLIYMDDLGTYLYSQCTDSDVRQHQKEIVTFLQSKQGLAIAKLMDVDINTSYSMSVNGYNIPIPSTRAHLLDHLPRALWPFTLRDHVHMMPFRGNERSRLEDKDGDIDRIIEHGNRSDKDPELSKQRALCRILQSVRNRDDTWSVLLDMRQMHSPLPIWAKKEIMKDAFKIEYDDGIELSELVKLSTARFT